MINAIRQYMARRRLQRLVDQTAASEVIVQYRKYRAAAKKGVARKRRFERPEQPWGSAA